MFKRLILTVSMLCFAAAFAPYSFGEDNKDTLYQISTLSALMKGGYDGEADVRDLKSHGDFGLGTFNRLDGEMVVLDGKIYQVKYDGTVCPVENGVMTPFAAITFFGSDKGIDLNEKLDLAGLSKAIDAIIENKNIIYAVRIKGRFDYIKTRSVPRQERPYRPLVEVTKDQSVFEMRDVEGTIVGFRVPEYMQGLNAAGYHLHFISEDRKAGGHLLQCMTNRVRVDIDDTPEFYMSLPENEEFSGMDLSGNQSKEIAKAEK